MPNWRNGMAVAHPIGEYTHQLTDLNSAGFHARVNELSNTFSLKLRKAAREWAGSDSTKTLMIYGIGDELITYNE